jgi:hypothetical protein
VVILETGTRVDLYWEYVLMGLGLTFIGLGGSFAFGRVAPRYPTAWVGIFVGAGAACQAYAWFHEWPFPVVFGYLMGVGGSWAALWAYRFRQQKGAVMFRHPRGDFRMPPLDSERDR